jgi:hypothetical protein
VSLDLSVEQWMYQRQPGTFLARSGVLRLRLQKIEALQELALERADADAAGGDKSARRSGKTAPFKKHTYDRESGTKWLSCAAKANRMTQL